MRRASGSGGQGQGRGKAVISPGRDRRGRAKTIVPLEDNYFLDWPWSDRPGRNMFFWVVGPPAFVFLSLLTMAVFSETSRR